MKVVILAGGLGSRLGEETGIRPKPMVCLGQRPILWHIMKIYSHYGFNDFVILCGYKGDVIKKYFLNYHMIYSDITVKLKDNTIDIVHSNVEPWTVTLLDTGINNMTGSRIKQARNIIGDERFMLTYGDGVADINICDLIQAHEKSHKLATVTVVNPESRFGIVEIDNKNSVISFKEKHSQDHTWISGGFFVLEPGVFNYIPDGFDVVFENISLPKLSMNNQLNAYKHSGFWRPMDLLRDKMELHSLWDSGQAPWKVWE